MTTANTSTKVKCQGGCGNNLTDPVSRSLGLGPKCYEDLTGRKQPRPKTPRRTPAQHRGRDVVEVDLLALAAATVDETAQETQA